MNNCNNNVIILKLRQIFAKHLVSESPSLNSWGVTPSCCWGGRVIRDNMEYNWSVNGLHGTLKHVPHVVTLVIVVTSYHKTLLFVNN